MALRKASAYSKKYTRPYTRKSSVKSKSYIKTIPASKVVKFQMGDQKGFEEDKLPFVLNMQTTTKVQIRDNALEAARQYIHKQLEEKMLGGYYFNVKVHPHHILRNHKMLTGAGADRMSSGMTLSFGSTEGRAALVPENHPIFVIAVATEKHVAIVRQILNIVAPKLPCKTRTILEKK